MFSFNFMFLCSLFEELCTKDENVKQVVTLILDMSVYPCMHGVELDFNYRSW